MSLYPLVQGGYLHMEIYLQLSRGTEEGQSMLFATAVSQVFLIQSNHCATVECFGVSCPAPHQEHRLPGPSPSSYRELTQGQSGAACLHTLWLQALSSAHLLSFSQVGVYHGCCFLVNSWSLSALIPSQHTHKGPEEDLQPTLTEQQHQRFEDMKQVLSGAWAASGESCWRGGKP